MDPIVNVQVNISPTATTRTQFNLGLILGNSTVLSTSERVAEYTSLAAMLTAGFQTSNNEYLAAQLYFSQTPTPSSVMVGVKGAEEDWATALTACREASSDWFAVFPCDNTADDIQAMAEAIQAFEQPTVLFYTTSDANVIQAGSEDIMSTLKDAAYNNVIGQYSTNANAAASIMGYAMASNTMLPGSFYTLDAKSEPGVATENITEAQYTMIKGKNGNAYVSRGGTYNLFGPGLMANGQFFDEVMGIFALTDELQRSVMDLLTSSAKVPQTDSGMAQLLNAINAGCQRYVDAGFLAPGIWTGAPVLDLNTGDALTSGYLVQAASIASQSVADRAARVAPPIYVCVKLAGAVQSVVINLNINQ